MAEQRLEFAILGPLEIRADGVLLRIGGPKQRALLALLLLSANRVVSRDRLVEESLGEQLAESADRSLKVQVSRLRKALGTAGRERLLARPPGYVLRVEPGELDLDRFEQSLAEGREALQQSDPEHASVLLADALSLWRGRPLADLEFEPFARVEVERLEELRLAALEERIDADLALGRHSALVPELEGLVAEFPMRERLRGQLMLALYRGGRQAEALEAYRTGRTLLSEELALDPSPRLRELEQAILRQDEALELPSAGAVAVAAPEQQQSAAQPVVSSPMHVRSRRRAALGIAVFGLALGLSLWFAVGRGGSSPSARVNGDAVVLVAPQSGRVKAAVPLTASPSAAVAGFGSLWVTQYDAGTVTRVDLRTRSVRQTIQVGNGPAGIATAAGAVWVANSLGDTVTRIDPATNAVVQRITVGNEPSGIVAAAGALWVSNRGDGTVSRLDPEAGRVVSSFPAGAGPTGLTAADHALWVSDEDSGTVTRISLADDKVVDAIRVGGAPSALATLDGRVWELDRLGATLSRIDPATDTVTATVPTAGTPEGLAPAGGRVWLTSGSGVLAALEPRRLTFETSRLGEQLGALAASKDGLWVAGAAGGASHRGGTLRVLNFNTGVWIDPAKPEQIYPVQLLGLTNDGLVTFDHVPGPDGTRIVPDLAVSLPAPTNGGRTYVFRLRPGIRYSTGRDVKPSDVLHTFERLFDLRSNGIGFYDEIVGAGACLDHRPCDLSNGIVPDDHDLTVTFNLTHPDPDFLYKLAQQYAFVLPASTPHHFFSSPLAATGPYVIAKYEPGRELLFSRNPDFREWSAAAQPDGYPDRIEWNLRPTVSQSVKLVEGGRADVLVNLGALPGQHRLRLHDASWLRTHSQMGTNFWALNTRAKPFDDVRVRRALNYALDRRVYVGIEGGSEAAEPTCQLLPPLVPGYRRYCPYTRSPSPSGRYLGPDLRRARALVAASGTRGMRVTIWDALDDRGGGSEGGYLATVLRKLGYRTSVHRLDNNHIFLYSNDSRNHAQIIPGGWSADYPSASDFIGKLTCANFVPGDGASTNDSSELCSRALDRAIARADALQATDARAGAAAWARLDRKLTNLAIWLPTTIVKNTDFVSPRVGNYEYHPLWGAMIDQLWVK